MSKTSKTAKYLLPGRIRKRLGVTSNPENHDYLKKIDVSSSKLVYRAIYELRKVSASILVPILRKERKSWARPDSNWRSSPCEGDVITG